MILLKLYFFDILHATILYPVAVEIKRGKCLTSEKERLAMETV